MFNPRWGRAATGKKGLASMHAGSLRLCPTLQRCRMSGWLSRQKHWSVLANTGCHTLLEHCISCCPSRQPPWIPGAARTPATQTSAPPPHLVITETNPRPPGQPQEQTPVDDPHTELETKPQLKPRGSVTNEEDPNPPTSYTSCRLNPEDQLGRLSVECLKGNRERPRKKTHWFWQPWTWRQEHTGVGPD